MTTIDVGNNDRLDFEPARDVLRPRRLLAAERTGTPDGAAATTPAVVGHAPPEAPPDQAPPEIPPATTHDLGYDCPPYNPQEDQ